MKKDTICDVLIVGGGHNGLVCACYLAAGGLKVRVLERRSIVGGAAVTEEFHPGFRNSVASYTVSLLHPKVIADLHLHDHGLKILERPVANFFPLSESACLTFHNDPAETRAEIARFSEADANTLPAFLQMLESVADVVRSLLLETPPNVGSGFSNVVRGLKISGIWRRLSLETQRSVHELLTRSAGEVLDAWFESDIVKAAFAFDAIVGNYSSLYTPGSAYVLLHHVIGEVNGKKGAWGHAVGGMGAITAAMSAEAVKRGVEISTGSQVARVDVSGREVAGVTLDDGTRIPARTVVSGINPKLLYLDLIDADALDSDFVERIKRYRCGSATFRMNVALSELPDFRCMPGSKMQPHHKSGIVIGPDMHYLERAFDDAKTHGWSRNPVVEMLIPSTLDTTLAPEGKHVASLFCQHFDPVLPNGGDWDKAREEAAECVIDTVNRYAPNFRSSILGTMVLSPADLEKKFGLVGGDIFHGELSLSQLYSARPVLGHGDYRGPLSGLYMCGSGTHPGGGVTGIPGHNAAREILKDRRWSWLRHVPAKPAEPRSEPG